MASSVFLQLADGFCVWKSKGCSEVFFCNKVVGLLLASSMSLSIVAVPVYIFVCFISASKLHVYSGVGPAIEVIKWHEKPEAMEPMEFMECSVQNKEARYPPRFWPAGDIALGPQGVHRSGRSSQGPRKTFPELLDH